MAEKTTKGFTKKEVGRSEEIKEAQAEGKTITIKIKDKTKAPKEEVEHEVVINEEETPEVEHEVVVEEESEVEEVEHEVVVEETPEVQEEVKKEETPKPKKKKAEKKDPKEEIKELKAQIAELKLDKSRAIKELEESNRRNDKLTKDLEALTTAKEDNSEAVKKELINNVNQSDKEVLRINEVQDIVYKYAKSLGIPVINKYHVDKIIQFHSTLLEAALRKGTRIRIGRVTFAKKFVPAVVYDKPHLDIVNEEHKTLKLSHFNMTARVEVKPEGVEDLRIKGDYVVEGEGKNKVTIFTDLEGNVYHIKPVDVQKKEYKENGGA